MCHQAQNGFLTITLPKCDTANKKPLNSKSSSFINLSPPLNKTYKSLNDSLKTLWTVHRVVSQSIVAQASTRKTPTQQLQGVPETQEKLKMENPLP